jgi:hypothetical protein
VAATRRGRIRAPASLAGARAAIVILLAAMTILPTARYAGLVDTLVAAAACNVGQAVLAGRCTLARAVARERAALRVRCARRADAPTSRSWLPRTSAARADEHEQAEGGEHTRDH